MILYIHQPDKGVDVASHEVKIIGTTEINAQHALRMGILSDITFGLIEVTPPITPGPEFESVILGLYQYRVSVSLIASSGLASIFLVRSGEVGLDKNQRDEYIKTIGDKIFAFCNQPKLALDFIQQNPFPNPA